MSVYLERTRTKTAVIIPPRASTNLVLNEIRRRLIESPFAALRSLRCDYHEGVAILRGNVPTFYTRQLAQSAVRRVEGVEQLDDRIVVAPRQNED